MPQVQKNSGTTDGSASVVTSLGSATTAGNSILIFVQGAGTITTPSGFTSRSPQVNQQGLYLFEKLTASGNSTDTPTLVMSGAFNATWQIAEYSGITAFKTSDGNNAGAGFNGNRATPGITPTSGAVLLVAVVAATAGTGTTYTAGDPSSWTDTFNDEGDVAQTGSVGAGRDSLVQGWASRQVTADGTTDYSTGATVAASNNSSAPATIIAAYAHTAGGGTQALAGTAKAATTLKSAGMVGRTALSAVAMLAARAMSGASGVLTLPGAATSLKVGGRADMSAQSNPTSSPVLVSGTPTAFNTNTTPKTASGITVQNGDVVVAHGFMEAAGGATLNIATTAGSTGTWTLKADVPGFTDTSQPYLRTWSTTATAPGTISVQFSRSGGSIAFGGIVKIYRNSSGVGAVQPNTGDGAPSVSLTTTKDLSALDYASVDWNATTGTATFTSSAGTPSTDLDVLASGAYRVYSSHVDAGATGSKTIGMSSPSSQRFAAVAVEVLGQGAVGALVARATVSSRGRSTFSGTVGVTAAATTTSQARATGTGRLQLAGRTAFAVSARIAQSVSLQFQTRFFPAMRGALTTTVSLGSSAGSAAMTRMGGDMTARTALAGKAASAGQSTAGVSASTSLIGAAKVASTARSTFSGRVILAIRTRFFPAMRGALNAAVVPTGVALAATAAVIGRARASIAGRTSLEGGLNVSNRARGGLSAIASITGRTASKATGAASAAFRTALAAAASVKTTSAGAMVGRVALFGRTAVSAASRATLPGTVVELLARATAVLRTVGGASARTSLSGKAKTSVTAVATPPTLSAFLAGAASVAAKARSGASATADFAAAARTRVAITARGTMSGVVGLAGRAKVASAVGLSRPFLPLVGRAVIRASAKALLFVLAPVIPTPVATRPSRLARLNQSLLKAFGEEFDIAPMTQAVDVNSRSQADISRAAILDIAGIWDGPTTSRTPHARGALQDDNAHNWNASYPSANFDDGLVAGVRKGDVLTRKLDGAVYEIVRVVPNGFGRTTLQLSKRKRTTH